MKKFLEELKVDEELANKILAKHNEEITTVNDELANVKTELTNANKVVKNRDKQLEDLKKTVGDSEELKKQIKDLQAENKAAAKAHTTELNNLKINSAIENSLLAYNAKTPKAVKSLLNMENIKIGEDGKVTGIDEQLKALIEAEDTKYLFNDNKPHLKGTLPGFGGNEKEPDLANMTYSQECAFIEAHPGVKI